MKEKKQWSHLNCNWIESSGTHIDQESGV